MPNGISVGLQSQYYRMVEFIVWGEMPPTFGLNFKQHSIKLCGQIFDSVTASQSEPQADARYETL